MKRLLLCSFLCVTLLIVACGVQDTAGEALDEHELRVIQAMITQHFDIIQEELGIEVQSMGTRMHDIHMTFRVLNAFGKEINEEQLEGLKQYLYELVGQKFPIELNQWIAADEGDLKGKITDIDGARVLIVDHQTVGQRGNPTATWVSFTNDAEIILQETGESLFFDDLAIGQRVEAWSTGMMLDSYPRQTSVVRLIIHEKKSENIRGDIVKMMSSWDDDRYRLHIFTEDIKETVSGLENNLKRISNMIDPNISFRKRTLYDNCIYMDSLEIAELPKFFVLDSTKIVLRTTQWEEVVDYLKENQR